jgi:hypothetical protein
MLPIRVFVGERLTSEALDACRRVKVSPDSIKSDVIDAIVSAAARYENLSVNDQIRRVYRDLGQIKAIKSHLSFIFQIAPPRLWQILTDPDIFIAPEPDFYQFTCCLVKCFHMSCGLFPVFPRIPSFFATVTLTTP